MNSSSPTKLSSEQLNNHYILFRHGQSKANVAKIVISYPENGTPSKGVGPPSPTSNTSEGNGWGLTEFGKVQVKSASQNLVNYLYYDNHQIHIKIFSSPFLRAIETANIVLTELLIDNSDFLTKNITIHPKVIIHDGLRERNFGIFELKSDHESYSKVWTLDESIITVPNNNNKKDEYKKIEVESCEEVCSRMCDVVREIEQQSNLLKEEQSLVAVLVSHGDSLQILQTAFENIDANLHRSLNHLGTSEWKAFGRKINNNK